MKAYAKFSKYISHRAGMSGFPPPYGLYMIPVKSNLAIYAFVSAGRAVVEGGWQHISVSVRHATALGNLASVKWSPASWRRRYPTMDELSMVRDMFFERYEAVVHMFPPLPESLTGGRVRVVTGGRITDFTVHLWHHPTHIVTPPPELMECYMFPP